jgi:hypothetical protein
MKIVNKVKLENSRLNSLIKLDADVLSKIEFESVKDLTQHKFFELMLCLFKKYSDEIVIGGLSDEFKWGDFCIETWNIHLDKYDYSLKDKSQETVEYLKMLINSSIEFDYSGYCDCSDWDKFLNLILNCLYSHVAPYSFLFHIPNSNFAFYLHHSKGLGLFFKKKNDDILKFVDEVKSMGFYVSYTDDDLF